ncbi:type IV secretion system protein VirB10 [Granulicella aggregans]|uniref:Type IV secretion system protein VirB10 n=1 Tax=Granulicella aggregans TaxID=474949 RepID=A0A7W7ZJT0_9BACT|nr:TrbI/VirB10 family protein [Granulicella aggregans]MBB5061210.1 type IV secretion system protein VirB10 [Granulicella aggregans]
MGTVPVVPSGKPPIGRTMPIVLVLTGAVVLIGASTAYNMFTGNHKKEPAKSTLQSRPSTADTQQVNGFEKQQALIQKSDADNEKLQQSIANMEAQERGMQAQERAALAPPEADGTAPMTPAQSAAIYGTGPNAPQQTSAQSEARAQAKQKAAEREKKRLDALNSDTVAIDFQTHEAKESPSVAEPTVASPTVTGPTMVANQSIAAQEPASSDEVSRPDQRKGKDPLAAYDFDAYGGKLYRVFEGTVLEGIITNHVDGGMSGPVLLMLTTDYYSHDRQNLLLPQGTRLIGAVAAVGNQQQHKLPVVFHRAVCPDGFSIDIDKYAGLDQIGTTGLATNVDHGYLQAFAAAAAIGGLGGLAQIGNNGSVLTADSQIRNGLSSQTSQESEQILNHFLNRLPIITLKEGSRARVYIGKDILIPSYAEHRVNPTL